VKSSNTFQVKVIFFITKYLFGGIMKIKFTNLLIMVFAIFWVFTFRMTGKDFFVSPTGNNSTGDGSIGNPWKTIIYAIDNVYPGDVLYLRAGVYNEQLLPVRSGSGNAYITISTYNNEDAYIDGTGVTSGNNGCLISNSYMKFRGFTVRNWLHDGITFSNCQFIELKNIKVTAVTGGISLKNTVHDFLLDSCVMYDYYGGAGGYGFDATPEEPNDRIYNGVIQNCKAFLTAGAYDNCDGFALGHDGVSNIHFTNCDVSSVGDGFDISGSGIVLERCSAHNSSYGGGYKLWRDSVTLINCIGYNNSTNVELDFDGSTNKGVKARLINCTFFSCWNTNVFIENTAGGSRLEMYNCILAGGDNTGLTFDGDNISCYNGDYNLFHMNNPERAIATSQLDFSLTQIQNGEWTTTSGQDAHSKVATNSTAIFKDTLGKKPNLHLNEGSLAINNGINLPDAPSVDFDNFLRNTGQIDIGAYEWRLTEVESEPFQLVNNRDNNIIIYPNPADDFINLYLPEDIDGKFELKIIDLSGMTVFNRVYETYDKAINISFQNNDFNVKLTKGIYLCIITPIASHSAFSRFIKN